MTDEEIKGNEHRIIRLTDWHYTETTVGRGRGGVTHTRNGIAENIICVGSYPIDLVSNNKFVKRVYEHVYGKDKWYSNFKSKTLKISKIVFKKALSLSLAPEYN